MRRRSGIQELTSRSRWWARRSMGLSEFHGILFWAGLVGFLGALVTVAFREAVGHLELLFTGQKGPFTQVAASLPTLERVLIPTIGSCLAGLVLQYGMRLAKGRTTTDYAEAITVGDGFISVRASLIRSFSSLCTIGSGGSIGREGAMVQLAAMLGSSVGRIIRFPASSRRLLVACGSAAGIASAYNAPLAASVFVAEILLGSLDLESVGPIIVSSVIANATVHQWMGYEPVYITPPVHLVSSTELLFFLALGVAAGHISPSFVWMLEKTQQFFHRQRLPLFLKLGLGGLIVGVLSAIEPRVWGNGYSVVNSILHQPWTWTALLLILVCKILATVGMVGSGAVGGVFTPTLFCGAVLGALVGNLVHSLAPGITADPSTYAVVGMGAFLCGATHAPLMSILMVFEMTHQYDIMLPLMLSSIAADYMAKRYRKGKSLYRMHPPRSGPRRVTLTELVRPVEFFVAPEATFEEINTRFSESPYNNLQVVDADGSWLGVISRRRAQAVGAPPMLARELVEPLSRSLAASMQLEEAMHAASDIHSETLPVIETQSRRLVGIVSKSDLLRALQRRLRELQQEPT